MQDVTTEMGIPDRLWTPTFFGFVLTQFLGAFNDNYFKQMVALTCVAQVAAGGADWQTFAMGAFALPFVILSGYAGYLADRYSKRTIIVLCKLAEILVMLSAVAVLLIPGLPGSTQLTLLIMVVALMGAHSSFFGPAKYGALPELFQARHLLPVNGVVQMTTFLAIILGTAAGGVALDWLNRSLWIGSMIAVGIAITGTLTSILIRKLNASQPDLGWKNENVAIPRDIRKLFASNRDLTLAMTVSTTFWFVGGVTQPAVNLLGKTLLGLTDTRTSLLASGIALGIAAGCICVGVFGGRSQGKWVNLGGFLFVIVALVVFFLTRSIAPSFAPEGAAPEPFLTAVVTATPVEWYLRCAMVVLGFSAGMIVVPVQVFLQQAPPAGLKGRMIGTQNLLSWVGILAAAVFLGLFQWILRLAGGLDFAIQYQNLIFLCLAGFMLPIALFYRLGTTSVGALKA